MLIAADESYPPDRTGRDGAENVREEFATAGDFPLHGLAKHFQINFRQNQTFMLVIVLEQRALDLGRRRKVNEPVGDVVRITFKNTCSHDLGPALGCCESVCNLVSHGGRPNRALFPAQARLAPAGVFR